MTIEKLEKQIEVLRKAHSQLTRALDQEKNEFIRDSAIQRFEFTFELFWKALKLYVEYEGKIANSPRAAIREAYTLGIINNDVGFFQMLEDRNNTTHAYIEALAEEIFSRLADHAKIMANTVDIITEKITK